MYMHMCYDMHTSGMFVLHYASVKIAKVKVIIYFVLILIAIILNCSQPYVYWQTTAFWSSQIPSQFSIS